MQLHALWINQTLIKCSCTVCSNCYIFYANIFIQRHRLDLNTTTFLLHMESHTYMYLNLKIFLNKFVECRIKCGGFLIWLYKNITYVCFNAINQSLQCSNIKKFDHYTASSRFFLLYTSTCSHYHIPKKNRDTAEIDNLQKA